MCLDGDGKQSNLVKNAMDKFDVNRLPYNPMVAYNMLRYKLRNMSKKNEGLSAINMQIRELDYVAQYSF